MLNIKEKHIVAPGVWTQETGHKPCDLAETTTIEKQTSKHLFTASTVVMSIGYFPHAGDH